ncbi:MAG: hypothetical protein KDA25_03385 [Phycisphaerales bacterium]|nr:hypothetical protein [Phycisphaerales bacterium]
MTLFGDQQRFAVEVRYGSDSARDIGSAFGRFRLWIRGQSFGCPGDSSSCFAPSGESLRQRWRQRGQHHADWVDRERPLAALREVHELVYLLTDDDLAERGLQPNRVAEAVNLMMAPDGSEAFDDGSLVIQWDTDDQVIVAGTIVTDEGVDDSIALIALANNEFYGIIQEAIRFLDAPPVTPL